MKKIVIQTEACIGCGACVGVDSEHFTFSEDGFSTVASQENLDSPALMDAIDACPVAIISLEEVENADAASQVMDVKETSCHCNPNQCKHCDCMDDEEEKAA